MHSDLPIVEKIKLDNLSCEAIYGHLKNMPNSFFLDSSLPSGKLGRFSFLGVEPFLIFTSKKNHITLNQAGKKEAFKANPFFVLKKLFKQFKVDTPKDFPVPFIGGGVGYFSYDLKDFTERLPDRARDDIDIPDSIVCFYDAIFAFDHLKREAFIISSGHPEKSLKKRNARKIARLEDVKRKIYDAKNKRENSFFHNTRNAASDNEPQSNFTKSAYKKAVEKAREYIKAGDIYQVNLSQRFTVDLNIDPFDLYKILRTINPAPFSSFLNFGDVKIVSASPERFLRKKGRHIQTRPIKGTRPRGKTPALDAILKKELTASAKDRAENLMIIDLERNDLGRICEYGSVRVTEFMACEKYSTVFHLVSTVEGVLRDKVDAIDCIINCFPGGSITGAPKIRSMEIIEELEPVKRAIYTGSIGYIGFDGNMDTSIAIRTFVIKGKKAFFQVGGGIVYDSLPEKEYQETLDKAKALIDAVKLGARRSLVYADSVH
ncbi:MAG: aminodeoxychorismate synthase component I [Candidatus Omnitrophica bacterium]|nr:aminodeoxychorismate synthase component I [Candidatus Omnitrophota bacterium]